jgi:hypothetical protein
LWWIFIGIEGLIENSNKVCSVLSRDTSELWVLRLRSTRVIVGILVKAFNSSFRSM